MSDGTQVTSGVFHALRPYVINEFTKGQQQQSKNNCVDDLAKGMEYVTGYKVNPQSVGRIFGPNLYTDLLASTSLTSDNLGEINHLNELLWAITYFWNRLKEICISFKGLLGLPGNLSLLGPQFLNTIFCPKGDRVGVIGPHVFMAQLPVVMITNTLLLGILYPYPYQVTCGLNFTR